MRFWVGVIGLLFAWLAQAQAQAHERSESTSHWTLVNGELHGIVTARTREVTRLTVPDDSYASLAQIFASHIGRSITASIDGVACTPRQAPAILPSEPGYLRADVLMRCSEAGPSSTRDRLTLKVDLFFGVAPSHHHFLYVAAGSSSREAILSGSGPSAEIELRPSRHARTDFLQFVGMGIEHIATGIDHLAFLLALLITARTARQVLAIVTGFTLGHSVTLSLAVLGVIQANREAVECLIGLTIAMSAAQNLIRGEREGRAAGLAAAAIAASLLLIPGDMRLDMPASLILAIAVATGSAVWLASMPSATARSGGGSTNGREASHPVVGVPAAASTAQAAGAPAAFGIPAGVCVPGHLVIPAGVSEPGRLAMPAGVSVPGRLAMPARFSVPGRLVMPARFSVPARFGMAAGFGLIHGLGFATALQELHLPRAMLLTSLLGFNVGVELGQLGVVSAAVGVIAVASKVVPMNQRRAEISTIVASAVLLAAGLAWFLTRAY